MLINQYVYLEIIKNIKNINDNIIEVVLLLSQHL